MSKKLNIDIETLKHLYTDMDKTTYEMADILHCDRGVITRRLKKHGIPIKRHKRVYSFYYEQTLNEMQKELILGSLIGDGHICKHHEGPNSCRFMETHSIKQLEYMKWKKKILENFVSNDITIKRVDKSYSKGLFCVFQTVLHKDLKIFRDMFYDNNGIKHIPYFRLSPLSLAVWYFDDGSIAKINQKGSFYSIQMHTQSYDHESILNLKRMLEDFGINSGTTRSQGYELINIGHRGAKKIIEIANKYVVPCMSYKIKFSDNPVETCSSS